MGYKMKKGYKKKNKYDFLLINRCMNGNWNGGKSFFGETKKITKGEEIKLLKRVQNENKIL